ncbi:neprilysin-1-like [Haemaphysalis longicornis]
MVLTMNSLHVEVAAEAFTRLLKLDVPAVGQRASHKAAKLLQSCLGVVQKGQSQVEPLVRFMRHVGLRWPLPSPQLRLLDLLVEMSLFWGIPVWGAFHVDTSNRDVRSRPLLVFGDAEVFYHWLQRKSFMVGLVQYDQYLSTYLRLFRQPADEMNATITAIAAADKLVEETLSPLLGEESDDLVGLGSLRDGDHLIAALNRLAYWIKDNYTAADVLRVRNRQLLLGILQLVSTTATDSLSMSFGWNVAQQLGQYVSGDLAMVQYFAFEAAESILRRDCFEFVFSFMTVSVGIPYVTESATEDLHHDVVGFLDDLLHSTEQSVLKSAILAIEHQKSAILRLRGMKKLLFWPEGVQGERDVDRMFGSIPDLRMPAFLDNWFLARQALRNLTVSAMPQVYHFPAVSAVPLYTSGNNALAVPVGAARFPMFSRQLVPAANFGGLARALSYAMAEALFFKRHDWVRGEARSRYQRRLDCLLDMVHSYQRPVAATQGTGRPSLPGGESVDESAAFSSSWSLEPLHRAYRAVADRSRRTTLSRAPHLDDEQLFFVSFCYSHCSREDSLDSRLLCNVPLRNFQPFANAFRCAPDSYMNPRNRCSTW